jgi:hypothetical protein
MNWLLHHYLSYKMAIGRKRSGGRGMDIQWNFWKSASTWTQKTVRFRGVASFVRLLLQRIFKLGLKNLADIQGGPVFWMSSLEKFHCIQMYILYTCMMLQYMYINNHENKNTVFYKLFTLASKGYIQTSLTQRMLLLYKQTRNSGVFPLSKQFGWLK